MTKVTPIITGKRMPNGPKPQDWTSVAMPQANRSALMSAATCSRGSLSALPRISGTATAPAYITRMCCKASTKRRPGGSRSSPVPIILVLLS